MTTEKHEHEIEQTIEQLANLMDLWRATSEHAKPYLRRAVLIDLRRTTQKLELLWNNEQIQL